ncbi:hypothetical protein GUITHDRAFT_153132 [Guillardia theta CCMP2712]|uniref:Uncharacterized protein n=1 Tax=Guillardia theta (strain CCMP2712) TaxID=905079 RepID=L1J679_GUITC|nr:hypothetical protein GUITHDRAFT_153132 [Guillardia theta CCMP2712]EKX44021.1 hypothetical protein GUITHDRAFT_153132 [Guillardia theta CCMP2712]|eukprot:XP_005831001.1 hypothetical protein GUITHDRAFT_153132 [Guillardia theta CCMP2712]
MASFQIMALRPFTVLPGMSLVEDTCNPLPGFIPTYKTVGADQSPGCKLYPEVIMNGGVPGADITFEPGLWGPSDSTSP